MHRVVHPGGGFGDQGVADGFRRDGGRRNGGRGCLVVHLQPLGRGLPALFRQGLQRAVDGFQEPRRIGREPAGERHVRVGPVFGKCCQPGLPVHRRLARDQVVDRGPKRVKIAPRALIGPRDVEFLRRVAVLDHAQRRHGAGGLRGMFPRRAKVDQDRLAGLVDQHVVGRDVAVQHVVVVDEADRMQKLLGDLDDVLGRKRLALAVDDLLQVKPVDVVQRHVGGAVVFEDVVDRDDVRMDDLGQAARLADEKLDDGPQFRRVGTRPGGDHDLRTAADRRGEALLDHDVAVEAVLGKISDAETAAVEVAGDRVLTLQQLRARLKFVDQVLDLFRPVPPPSAAPSPTPFRNGAMPVGHTASVRPAVRQPDKRRRDNRPHKRTNPLVPVWLWIGAKMGRLRGDLMDGIAQPQREVAFRTDDAAFCGRTAALTGCFAIRHESGPGRRRLRFGGAHFVGGQPSAHRLRPPRQGKARVVALPCGHQLAL